MMMYSLLYFDVERLKRFGHDEQRWTGKGRIIRKNIYVISKQT